MNIQIGIDFSNSGVKTCKNIGIFFLVFAMIGFFVSFIMCLMALNDSALWSFLISSIIASISCLAFGGLLMAVSSISKNSIMGNIQRDELLRHNGIEIEFYQEGNGNGVGFPLKWRQQVPPQSQDERVVENSSSAKSINDLYKNIKK